MRRIISIDHVQEQTDKNGKIFWRTFATLDDGSEAVGFGKEFEVGDEVQHFFHFGVGKMRKPLTSK